MLRDSALEASPISIWMHKVYPKQFEPDHNTTKHCHLFRFVALTRPVAHSHRGASQSTQGFGISACTRVSDQINQEAFGG